MDGSNSSSKQRNQHHQQMLQMTGKISASALHGNKSSTNSNVAFGVLSPPATVVASPNEYYQQHLPLMYHHPYHHPQYHHNPYAVAPPHGNPYYYSIGSTPPPQAPPGSSATPHYLMLQQPANYAVAPATATAAPYPTSFPPSSNAADDLSIIRPETEESFCSNFVCCGVYLADLHALLQHYEEVHVAQSNASRKRSAADLDVADSLLEVGGEASRQQQPQRPASVGASSSSSSRLAALTSNKANLQLLCTILSNTLEQPLTPKPQQPQAAAAVQEAGGSTRQQQKKISYSSIMIANRPAIIDRSSSHPYKCPVPNCRRVYKNPNGLKYHAAHAHLNLKEDKEAPSGPSSSAPQEEDFEEEDEEENKPHRCLVPGCGKRYKNANGLKYHAAHAHLPGSSKPSPQTQSVNSQTIDAIHSYYNAASSRAASPGPSPAQFGSTIVTHTQSYPLVRQYPLGGSFPSSAAPFSLINGTFPPHQQLQPAAARLQPRLTARVVPAAAGLGEKDNESEASSHAEFVSSEE